jgi:protein phosphatase
LVELRPDATALIGHVGDSRAYAYSKGELVQLTEDHTVAAEMVHLGELTPEGALNHPQSHMLTRCLGLTRFVNVDEITLDLEVGDRLLLCSDGLTSMVKDERIADILGTESLEDTVWKLIDEANNAGGVDNISVIVVEVVE